jgi:hypothetical protein
VISAARVKETGAPLTLPLTPDEAYSPFASFVKNFGAGYDPLESGPIAGPFPPRSRDRVPALCR